VAWLKTIFQGLLGLFVEDGSFALAILGWLAFLWFVLPRLPIPGALRAIILFVGLLAILIESVLRRSARR
jgi:hypothetical protein